MAGADLGALVLAARSGDEDAFGLLWRTCQPRLRRYLRVVAAAHADEVSERTWADLVRTLHRVDGDESDWLVRLFAVARRRVPAADRPAGRIPAADPRVTLDEVVTEVSLALLAALPVAEREVLALRLAGGLTAAQTCRVLKLAPETVRALSHSGLARAGVLASSAAFRGRIDRGEPAGEPADWLSLASLPEPRLADALLADLLSGRPAPAGEPRRWQLLAGIVSAASGPLPAAELTGSGAAYAAFRRQFAPAPRHATPGLARWLGSRAAVVLGASMIGVCAVVTAAYGGVLPLWLHDVAHQLWNAPAGNGGPQQHRPPPAVPGGSQSGAGAPARSAARDGASVGATPTGRGGTPSALPGSIATASAPSPSPTPPAPGTGQQVPPSGATPPSTGAPRGATSTPPGSTKTPPGSTKTPPGSTKTPPGSTKTPPSSTKTPPSQSPSRRPSHSAGSTRSGTPRRPQQGR